MKNLLLIAMMALASLLFIANGASAQYCSSFLPSCHYQLKAGERGNEEMTPATSGTENGNGEFMPAAPRQEQAEEFTAAGSSSHKEYMTPKNAPYEAPAESEAY
jgi:hypothetical protein